MELALLLVEPARRPEVGQPELAAVALMPLRRTSSVPRCSISEARRLRNRSLRVRAVLLLELLPLLGLGGVDEIEHVLGDQAERAVVVLRRAGEVAAGGEVARRPSRTATRSPGAASGPPARSAASMVASKFFSEMSTMGILSLMCAYHPLGLVIVPCTSRRAGGNWLAASALSWISR